MAAALEALSRVTPPAEWALLPAYDGEQGTLWQVWMRDKNLVYWAMKSAVKIINHIGTIEAQYRGTQWEDLPNLLPLEEGGLYPTRDEAEDFCRLIYQESNEKKAVTITPVVIGRSYPTRRVKAIGERRFDPFKIFDFSATDDVKKQASRVLIDIKTLEQWKKELERVHVNLT